jgi:uncharacterized protein (UPF0333 family)
MMKDERAQVSFEYLLMAVFAIMLSIGAAIVIETMRQMALDAQGKILTTRSEVIGNLMAK